MTPEHDDAAERQQWIQTAYECAVAAHESDGKQAVAVDLPDGLTAMFDFTPVSVTLFAAALTGEPCLELHSPDTRCRVFLVRT